MTGVRSRDFRLLVASSGLSALGDELALIALTIKVADLTDSGIAVAALLIAGLLPMVVLAPIAGVVVDRFETTRTLAVTVTIQAGLAVALAFATSIPLIIGLAFCLGVGAAIANPAVFTLVPTAVGEEHLTEANAYLETGRYAGMVAGPVLAGVLAAGPGSRVALLVDAGTFLAIGLAAAIMKVRRRPDPSETSAPVRRQAREGFSAIAHDRILVITFTAVGVVVLFAAMDNVAEVFYARESLGAGDWGFGLLAGGWLLGMVGGAVLIGRRLPTPRLVPAWMTSAVVGGVAVALAALFPIVVFAVGMFVIGGVANGVQSVSARSLIGHRLPDRLRGRGFAAYSGLAMGMQLAATAVGGVIVAMTDGRTVLLIGGLGSAVAGACGYLWYALQPADVKAPPVLVPESDEIVDVAAEQPVQEGV